jgi:hypothetical protein
MVQLFKTLEPYLVTIMTFNCFHLAQVNNSAYALARAALSHISRNIFDIILNCITIIIL